VATSAVVEFEGIVKDYPPRWPWLPKHRAVSDVSFRIEPGEVVGLLGPNRAGKTTLIKVLLSLCRPTGGRVVRFGQPAANRSTLARIGYMHESPAFPRYLTAADLLDYYAALTLLPRAEVRPRIPSLLEQVGLDDRSHEPIARFSKGMVQRLALAQALVNTPDLLVLDEPNEGLDLPGRDLVRKVVNDQRQRGKSVLLVSHAVGDVEQLCDRVAVVVAGRLVHIGPLSSLTKDAKGGRERTIEQTLQALYRSARQ
jgi:ABC-2 type transport system ATP-binding protein